MEKILVIFLFLFANSIFGEQQKGKLIIHIEGFKSNEGKAYVALHNNPKSFPMIGDKAYSYGIYSITNNQTTVEFDDIDYGEYAVSVFHDENNDGKLNTNFLGIPKESVGVSKNVKGRFGPPKFEDAKFNLNQSIKKIFIKMQ